MPDVRSLAQLSAAEVRLLNELERARDIWRPCKPQHYQAFYKKCHLCPCISIFSDPKQGEKNPLELTDLGYISSRQSDI